MKIGGDDLSVDPMAQALSLRCLVKDADPTQ